MKIRRNRETTNWKLSNEPTGTDCVRMSHLDQIEVTIHNLRLTLLRFRKLNGIFGALTVQVEDGGDSPEVNNLLLDALRAAVRHQVGEQAGADVFQAIDAFAQADARYWELARTGDPLPRGITPEERVDEPVRAGYELLRAKKSNDLCWCGSGKKYKLCHRNSDQEKAKRGAI